MPENQEISLSEPVVAQLSAPASAVRARVVKGSAILLASTGIVAAINLSYNVVMARMLGTAGFGHAAAIYTLLMLASAITLSFQLVCSKYVARSSTLAARAAVYRGLHRRAWKVGVAMGLLLLLGSKSVAGYLNLPSRHDIMLLGLGVAIYIALGVRRGKMQGCYEFSGLASSVIVEAGVKFLAAALLVYYGFGVTGTVAGVVLSLGIAYLVANPGQSFRRAERSKLSAPLGEGLQAALFFTGQVLISNVDILLVKHYFEASQAGLYAGVALVGRVVYMLSWSVVGSMFPASASSSHEKAGQSVLRTSLILASGLTSVFVFMVWLAPERLWTLIFGRPFLLPTLSSFSSLVTLYAAMTGIYGIAVVLMVYEMSRRVGHAGWVQIVTGGMLAGAIAIFHHSLSQVIVVQLVLMGLLLAAVSLPLWLQWERAQESFERFPALRRIRRVDEEEVIAEFLKGEFYHHEFDPFRDEYRSLVQQPVFAMRENEMRRALLYRRRGKLWRELPNDTEWWEIALAPGELNRIRAFPRDDWRRFAKDGFFLVHMIGHLRQALASSADDRLIRKLRDVQADVRAHRVPNSVLLIGQNDVSPMTVIEGNHRLAAAMLLDERAAAQRFRVYCGFSQKMTTCCWYRTDLKSLSRYAWHLFCHMFDDDDDSVLRVLREAPPESAASSVNAAD